MDEEWKEEYSDSVGLYRSRGSFVTFVYVTVSNVENTELSYILTKPANSQKLRKSAPFFQIQDLERI